MNTTPSSLLRDLWNGVLDLVYPPKCLVCGEIGPSYLCENCASQVEYIRPPICRRCGAPMQEGRCVECRGTEFEFDSAQSVGVYDGVLRDAIHQLKYSGHRVLGPLLGHMMVEYLRGRMDLVRQVGCIVPVPIHPSRVRERGFNQSELLATQIGRGLAIPVLPNVLVRTRRTRPQVNLPFGERWENMIGAFAVKRPDAVAGRSVLLVDDVFTTGSTSHAASLALHNAAAREVHVLTLARSM